MNAFTQASMLNDEGFIRSLATKLGQTDILAKADTISQATGLLWYDLRPVVQMLYPYKELIPLISRLPRVPADGGNAFHWKRINAVNVNNIAIGISEGNRGGRIAVLGQDQQANYKTLGLEGSATFESHLGAKNLQTDALGLAVQGTLRSTMVGEEQALILGNASTLLGQTPTPNVTTAVSGGNWGGTVNVFVICVALSGMGWLDYTPYNSASGLGGVQGLVTRPNVDGTTDTFGGGSALPSVEASAMAVTATQSVVASVTPVPGAVAYAWYVGTATGVERLAGITQSAQIKLTQAPPLTAQPLTALQSSGSYRDNSANILIPDGILSQIYGSVFGQGYVTSMASNPSLPSPVGSGDTLLTSSGGSLVYTKANGNSGLTIQGSNILEFDAILQAAYDQYKLGFNRILMSSTDLANFSGTFFGSGNNSFRILFDADAETGHLVAGRRVTSYMNKFFNNTLDIEVHPFVPPGTILFWSDRTPYELSDVPNLIEAHVRQDYYQIEWPLRTRRYEFGVYVDEVFSCYFTPAFAVITNLNGPTGSRQI